MQVFLSYAFRPFFLLNGVFGIVAVVLWVAMLTGHGGAFVVGNTVMWHAHEMLAGFIMATIAGFVLTAGANWTGRPPVSGQTLGWLVLCWLLGRVAMLLAGMLPTVLVAGADMLFPLLLTALLGREIIAAGNRRNYKVVVMVAVLAVINGLYHLGSAGVIDGADRLAVQLFVHVVVLLIAVIAGRIVPNFTANWLRSRGHDALPVNNALHDRTALSLTIVVGLCASLAAPSQLTGTLALAAALAHAVRLSRWRGAATTAEPLLLALHVAYAWLPLGYLVLAASSFGALFTPTIALHALTMGAVGSMIMAMQTRVPLGHTGRALTASRATVAAYLLLTIAVLFRIVGPLLTEDYLRSVLWSAAAWIAAFTVYVRIYWPVLTRPRVDR
jgi:uncharacterized protein involved in response to NO